MGSGLQVAFPLVRMVDGRWTSANASDWLGAFAAYLGLLERSRGDTAAADHYDAMVERYLDVKQAELRMQKPDMILVQKFDELWLDRMFQRETFVHFMRDYRLLTEDAAVQVYLLDRAGPAASRGVASD